MSLQVNTPMVEPLTSKERSCIRGEKEGVTGMRM
jgi:hypothetical protein